MQKRQILINAVMSMFQPLVMGGVLFILYRFLLNTIGIEKLGVWSVVLATSSVAAIARKGLSASVVKFVAKYLAKGDKETASDVVQTNAISIGLFSGIVFLFAYPFVAWLLKIIIPADSLEVARSILPYAMSSLWVMVVASVLYAGLDGFQRIDLRSTVIMGGAIFHVILCFLIVPHYGLMGLAYAQVAQSVFILFGSWVLLRRKLPALPVLPYRWNYKLFREMLGYGLNFQVITMSQMLYDPITKALLTKFGGLTMAGFYEMASRMVVQFRTILVSANQALVPTIADLQEKNPELIQKIYRESYRLLLYVALPYFSAIIMLTPIISRVWIGHYENVFVLFSILLATGWFLDTLVTPAYFANLGIGELRWNTTAHVITGVLNLLLGFICGTLYGGTAVVVTWTVSLVAGGLIIPIMYHHRHHISLLELVPKEHIGLGLASVTGLLVSLGSYQLLSKNMNLWGVAGSTVSLFLAFVAFPVWANPMRRRLIGWFAEAFSKL